LLKAIHLPPLSRLVDAGRSGYRRLGVAPNGPSDQSAFRALLPEGGVALEFPAWGACFEALSPCEVSFLGPDCLVTVNGRSQWLPIVGLGTGDRLEFHPSREGNWMYLAQVDPSEFKPILNSYCGIECGPSIPLICRPERPVMRPDERRFLWYRRTPIGVSIEDPHLAQRIEAAELRIDPMSNRTGIRLTGLGLTHRQLGRTRPTLPGLIQWTPSGELIVLGREGPTLGGYPIIGYVPEVELDRLNQWPMNEPVRLQPCSEEAIERLENARQRQIDRLAEFFKPER
jgi:allophanate hydrolase subunit 2